MAGGGDESAPEWIGCAYYIRLDLFSGTDFAISLPTSLHGGGQQTTGTCVALKTTMLAS